MLGISYDQFIRTTDPAHKTGVKALIEQIFDKSPGRLLRESLCGLVLRRLRGVQAGQRDRRWKVHPAPHAHSRVGGGEELVLPAKRILGSSEVARLDQRVFAAHSRRNEILSLIDQGLEDVSASRSRFTWGIPFPRKGSAGESPDDLRVVRSAAQLSHRDRISKPRFREALAR